MRIVSMTRFPSVKAALRSLEIVDLVVRHLLTGAVSTTSRVVVLQVFVVFSATIMADAVEDNWHTIFGGHDISLYILNEISVSAEWIRKNNDGSCPCGYLVGVAVIHEVIEVAPKLSFLHIKQSNQSPVASVQGGGFPSQSKQGGFGMLAVLLAYAQRSNLVASTAGPIYKGNRGLT